MRIQIHFLSPILKMFGLLSVFAASSLHAAAKAPQVSERDCLQSSQIRSTAVLNDRQIAYQLRDRSVWINNLDHRCPGLDFSEAFSTEIRGSSVCAIDHIRVLENYSQNFQLGAGCGLGKFTLSEKTMRTLRTEARAK